MNVQTATHTRLALLLGSAANVQRLMDNRYASVALVSANWLQLFTAPFKPTSLDTPHKSGKIIL